MVIWKTNKHTSGEIKKGEKVQIRTIMNENSIQQHKQKIEPSMK